MNKNHLVQTYFHIAIGIYLIFMLSGCGGSNGSGSQGGGSYFPLEIGNKWSYAPARADLRHKLNKWEVSSDSLVNGEKYYVIQNTFSKNFGPRNYFARIDSSNILWFIQGQSIPTLIMDLELDEDSVFTQGDYQVTFKNIGTIDIDEKQFSHCIEYVFEAADADEDSYSYTLSPGVGIVKMGNEWIGDIILISHELKIH